MIIAELRRMPYSFQPLEIVCRYRDSQLQVTTNYLNLLNSGRNDYCRFETYFLFKSSLFKAIETQETNTKVDISATRVNF